MESQVAGVDLIAVMIIFLMVQAGLAFIPAYIAKNKGRSYAAFWCLGFFGTVFLALIAVLAIPERKGEKESKVSSKMDGTAESLHSPSEAKCPNCAEYIKTEAKICRFCQTNVASHFKDLANQLELKRKESEKQAEEEERLRQIHEKAEQQNLEAQREAYEKQRVSDREKFLRLLRKPTVFIPGLAVIVGVAFFASSTINAKNLESTKLADNVAEATILIKQCGHYFDYQDYEVSSALPGLEGSIGVNKTEWNDAFSNCILNRVAGIDALFSLSQLTPFENSEIAVSEEGNYLTWFQLKPSWQAPSFSEQFPVEFGGLAKAFDVCKPTSGYRFIAQRGNQFSIAIARKTNTLQHVPTAMASSESECLLKEAFGSSEAQLLESGSLIDPTNQMRARASGSKDNIAVITIDAE